MKEFVRKIFSDTASKGIVALIVAVLTLLVPPVRVWLIAAWRLLDMRVEIPLWLLIILITLVLVSVLYWLSQLLSPEHEVSYVEDSFDGINWRWEYKKGRIADLRPFCVKPDCGVELMLEEKRERSIVSRQDDFVGTHVYCTGCNSSFAIMNAFDLPDHARRKIEKRIHDGSWKMTTK